MGASQSSTSGTASAPEPDTEIKTSYYELLSVERNATEDELKKAYRRKALELHPDRNYGNVEHATRLFAEVQSAYEVLSDPQERAWYDSHESAILRGDDGGGGGNENDGPQYEYNTKVTSADDIARMMRKFNSSVEFSDAPSGFFGYLRETFEQLRREEEVAAQWEGVDVPEYPAFGHKDDEYEDVVRPFYSVWIGFSTRKTFAWKDRYRLSEAPDRRYRRAMEKENAKFREEGVREFNEAVRALVAFVRKRDPRYIPNTQTEAERQKVLRDAAAAQKARARAENAAKFDQEVPDWAMVVERDEHEGEVEDTESEEEHFECVACRKIFKSEKQWEAHEKSKKHQKAVYALRKKMQKENKHLNLDSESGSSINTPGSDDEDGSDLEPVTAEVHAKPDADGDDGDGLEDEAAQVKKLTIDEDETDEDEETKADHANAADTTPATPATPATGSSEADSDNDNDEYAPAEAVKDRLVPTQPPVSTQGGDNDNDSDDWNDKPRGGKKMGKAAQKRAKKAAAAATAEATEDKFKCATCNATFPSKTRLHQHIKDENHAALKSVSGGSGGAKGKKGRR